MNIYIDESIHSDFGFMILAYVLCKYDPQEELERVIATYKKNEYHSSERMQDNEDAQALRSEISGYVNYNCKWGVCVFPSSSRWNITNELNDFITRLIQTNKKWGKANVFLDEGIIKRKDIVIFEDSENIETIAICKSHKVNGIQLSDLVASLCGIRLREEISQKPKILSYGKEVGFDPPIEAELGFEFWADLRYSMYRKNTPIGEPGSPEFSTIGHGLHVSVQCTEKLKTAAEKLFGTVYLGCIH